MKQRDRSVKIVEVLTLVTAALIVFGQTPSTTYGTPTAHTDSKSAPPPKPAPPKRDPKAVALVEAMSTVVDPTGVWGKLPALRFTYGATMGEKLPSVFKHTWDFKSGQYRVDGIDNDGNEKIAMFQVGATTGEGWVRLRFTEALSASLGDVDRPWLHPPGRMQNLYIQFAYQRFRNDTLQLLLPLRMKDADVALSHEGTRSVEGMTYEVVKVTLPRVGLVPEETYWVYLDPKTHKIGRTEYQTLDEDILAAHEGEGNLPAGPRVIWLWEEWQAMGPFVLSAKRSTVDGKGWMRFTSFDAPDKLPLTAFEKPPKGKPLELPEVTSSTR